MTAGWSKCFTALYFYITPMYVLLLTQGHTKPLPIFITLVFISFQLRLKLAGVDEACYVMVAAVKDFFSGIGQDTNGVLSFLQYVSLSLFISSLLLCIYFKTCK